MWYCLVSIILGNAGWNECIMQNRKIQIPLVFIDLCFLQRLEHLHNIQQAPPKLDCTPQI